MAVWPDLGQAFSDLGDSPTDGRVLGVNRANWRDMILPEALVYGFVS